MPPQPVASTAQIACTHLLLTLALALALALVLALFGVAGAQAEGTTGPSPAQAQADRLVLQHPAFGPALAWRSPAGLGAEAALAETLRSHGRLSSGLDATLRWRPSVGWRGGPANGWAWRMEGPRWPLDLNLRWMHDPAVQARAELQLFQAEAQLAQRVHRDLRDALSAYIDLQRAHIALSLAEQAMASQAPQTERAQSVESAAREEAGEGDGPPSTTLATSLLALERAQATLDRAARDLAAAERRADSLGFDLEAARWAHGDRLAPLALEGWRLHLAPAEPLRTPAVQRALLDLALARASAQRLASTPLDDLWFRAEGIGEVGRWSTALHLDEGRPRIDLGLEVGGGGREGLSLQLGAVFRLDSEDAEAATRAERQLAEAEQALLRTTEEAAWLLERALQAALDAEADVAFAERALAIARQALGEALATWRRSVDPDLDPLGEHRDQADAALLRLILGLERERDAYYRAWNQYLLEAERYWTASGGWGGVLVPDPLPPAQPR